MQKFGQKSSRSFFLDRGNGSNFPKILNQKYDIVVGPGFGRTRRFGRSLLYVLSYVIRDMTCSTVYVCICCHNDLAWHENWPSCIRLQKNSIFGLHTFNVYARLISQEAVAFPNSLLFPFEWHFTAAAAHQVVSKFFSPKLPSLNHSIPTMTDWKNL